MAGYTPVFKSILQSTVWECQPHVKVVWMTMLLMCDKKGIVEGSIPGMARAAVVTREQCEEALTILSAPDPDSRTKDFEGRRIEAIDGGWRLLNHETYKKKLGMLTASSRERVKRHRERKSESANVTDRNALQGVSVTECNHQDQDLNQEQEKEEKKDSFLPEKPKPRDPLREQLTGRQPGQNPDVVAVHDEWRRVFGKMGAKLGNPNSDKCIMIRKAISDYSLEDCLEVIRYAPRDGMVNGRDDEQKKKHDDLFYILGNQRTFDRLLVEAKKQSATTSNGGAKAIAANLNAGRF